ncbi:MAG: hypothetical protein HOF68_11560 [Nitrospina sp.]|jgi:hypothetical protein|nr:hypothetical protein [Nitrospina sp.]MBT6739019.1 hypothetical protein [Nitrospina sp.]MBT7198418.1 hypothetical protein [Nitrospina sp.]MBT7680875.1 hypothetical protein [Nitrospina sp.]MBT7709375.1 hypothetical protein [Nitrospina sp.]
MPGKKMRWMIPTGGFHLSSVLNLDFVFYRMMGFPDGFGASAGCSRSSGKSLVSSKRYSFKNGVKYHDCYRPLCF